MAWERLAFSLESTALATALLMSPAATGRAGGRPFQGRLVSVRALLYNCSRGCQGPAGYYEVASAGPQPRFRRARPLPGSESLATPVRPAISPDGHWLLYTTRRWALVVQPFDAARLRAIGRRQRIRMRGLGPYGMPTVSWSPDSRRLVLAGTIRDKSGLWIVRRDGTGLRRVVCGCHVGIDGRVDDDEIPVWSRRGGIAFVGAAAKQPQSSLAVSIYVVRPDGTHLRQVTAPHPKPLGGGAGSYIEDSGPEWSPDGRELVFVHDVADGVGDLRIVEVATRRQRQLHATGESGTWAPDGRSIAYITRFGDGIRLIPAAGGRSRSMGVHPEGGFLVDLDWRRSST